MATKVNEHDCAMIKQDGQANDKDSFSGTKVKRKSRSARRRLNAMMSNASFHFSDTDSEGELTMITNKIGKLNPAEANSPLISVTDAESIEPKSKNKDNLDYLIADGEARSRSRRSSFVENLTDVDEIYSDPEIDEKATKHNLKAVDNGYQGETDLEDIEGDDDIQPTIYVEPRSDIFAEFGGEMITTKEGDGPFSVEVRNRLSREQISIDKKDIQTIPDMPNTDSEDMEASDDEIKLDEAAAYSSVYQDFDVLAASQIVMTNKVENTLHVPDAIDEAISDCHTDVEDVD
ncbi:uncharacterized protein [Linepithema humile]|uniref:uncharacterized protein n=1 Tax=Linepithema humile TaxID=83485 RepID=UPI0006230946|nr:PREDICTED: uncharacterized protein LOC105672211 [Linepithema humile]